MKKWVVLLFLSVAMFGQSAKRLPEYGSPNLAPPVDFSTGQWTKTAAVTSSGPGTFVTNAAGGCYPAIVRLKIGTRYRLTVNMTSGVAYEIRHGSAEATIIATASGVYDFTARATDGVYLRLSAAGTATVGKLTIQKR